MSKGLRTQLLQYGLAPIAVGLAVGLRLFLASWLESELYFLFLWPAVIVTAWYGGLGPGLFATILAALAANYYFLPPVYTLSISTRLELIVMLLFMVIGCLISLMSARLHRTADQLQRTSAEIARQAASLRVILAGIGDAVLALDSAGRVTFMNASAQSLTGWSESEATNCPHEEVFRTISAALWRTAEKPVAAALRDHAQVSLGRHTVLLAKDGTARPIEGSVAPLHDECGALTGVVLTFRDVTEQRSGEEARAQLAAIVECSEDAIVSRNLDGIVTTWNPGAERLYGYKADEMIGRSMSSLVPGDQAGELAEVMQKLRHGERIRPFKATRVRKDGVHVDVSISIAPVKNEAGKVVGATVIARPLDVPKG
jgi:PAS domain S-box-containing protein